eukprot:6789074-Alexandrium_andersonii.AAC.1
MHVLSACSVLGTASGEVNCTRAKPEGRPSRFNSASTLGNPRHLIAPRCTDAATSDVSLQQSKPDPVMGHLAVAWSTIHT